MILDTGWGPYRGAPALRFWIDVRGGDKGALSPVRLMAYLPGNNLAGFGRTGTNLLKLGLGLKVVGFTPHNTSPPVGALTQGRLEKPKEQG